MSSSGEILLSGQVAAPGLALGRVVRLAERGAARRMQGSVDAESAALEAALTTAAAGLAALIQRLEAAGDSVGAEMLEFQQALLEDDDLLLPIYKRVAGGAAADAAWAEAMAREAAGYAAAEDETFRARAADLEDLRQRVLAAFRQEGGESALPDGPLILVAHELTPSRFLETDWQRFRGAALAAGSASSHVAMLARARGVALLIGLGAGLAKAQDGDGALLDGERGRLVLHPGAATRQELQRRQVQAAERQQREQRYLARPAATATGAAVQVLVNVDDPAVLLALDPAHCDGIGLARSEFLFRADRPLPDEAAQFAVYRQLLAWAKGRPVVIRTLDAGGDKPIPGLTPDGESNPFLGVRGLRLSLARPEIFRVQLRALARAAPLGRLKVMVPMVTAPHEMAEARRLFEAAVSGLKAEGVAAALPPLGMMVEVPAAALTAADFPADFYSIGSNDLVQYVTAVSRDSATLAKLYDPANPAVLELIGRVVEAGRRLGREVSLCGDMAGEPALIAQLLRAGLRSLSVAPARLAGAKAAVAAWPSVAEAAHG
jgi:phosphotransferase system enzyme I (PtsI)